MANQTVYPFGFGGELPFNISVVNDTVTGGSDKALAAEQGKILAERLDEYETEVTQDGIYFVDANFKVGAKITNAGLVAVNILNFEEL